MGYIYSGSNTTSPIGKVMDYNNTNPSRGVAIYRLLGSENTVSTSRYSVNRDFSNEFSNAIYGDGPYSLLHPNSTTEMVANNIDTIA